MIFRDDWERKAHDVICTIKYGGAGGSVRVDDVRRIGDILRGRPLAPQFKVTVKPPPSVTIPKVVVPLVKPPIFKIP